MRARSLQKLDVLRANSARPDARSSAPIAGARTRRHNVEGRDQGRQVTRAAITKECQGMPRDARLGRGYDFLEGFIHHFHRDEVL